MGIITNMPKLAILARERDEYTRLIEAAHLPGLEVDVNSKDCDIVLGEPNLIRDALPRLSALKWAQSIYAGVEPLVELGHRHDYILTNARGVFGELMSEYVFGYLLFHEKKILERIQAQQAKQWQRPESGVLRGKTLGLLGVGSIGGHLAGTAKHFRMTVKGFTKESETSPQVDQYFHGNDLLAFAAGLDYLICVLPRTNDTNQIIDRTFLKALPSHAILINVGRGNAVDEPALVEALTEGKLTAAVLDVFGQEPLPEDHPFWTTPNLYMTFHTSATSFPEDLTRLFVENYHLYVEGKTLKHIVDFKRGY